MDLNKLSLEDWFDTQRTEYIEGIVFTRAAMAAPVLPKEKADWLAMLLGAFCEQPGVEFITVLDPLVQGDGYNVVLVRNHEIIGYALAAKDQPVLAKYLEETSPQSDNGDSDDV